MQQDVITLTEYVPSSLPPDRLTPEEGRKLWEKHRTLVTVEFPSPKTHDQWQLTAQGWVGYLPVSSRLGLSLQPKIPLHNLFQMVVVAYDLSDLSLADDLFACSTVPTFFDQLARALAQRIETRYRRGLHQDFVRRWADLPYVRGTLRVDRVLQRRDQTVVPCCYDEPTMDLDDNRILAWTLWTILRSGLCTAQTEAAVRRVYRRLRGAGTLEPVGAEACIRRIYTRLNQDYRRLHALCRFFLEQSGPSQALGDREMLAFLIDMARLYEQFVAAWLRAHLDPQQRLQIQERVRFGVEWHQQFTIDLVLYDRRSGAPHAVLDTKYKTPAAAPSADDVAQVIAYATAKGCTEAILIYPASLRRPLDERIGNVRVRTLTFPLDRDLDESGHSLLQQLSE